MLDSYDNVSDLNITVGKPFQVETAGELAVVDMEPRFEEITPFQAEIFALNLLNQNRRLTENLLLEGSCDSSYELPGKARFRVNIFSQRGNYSVVLRRLATKIPTCQELGLPKAFLKMAEEKNGFILVTGATGTGKTTSLAALLNEINDVRSVHVVTLEDPVEYDHPHKMATFNQREMGEDFTIFSELLLTHVADLARRSALAGGGAALARAHEEIGNTLRQASALNLDRRQTVLDMLGILGASKAFP